MRVREYDSDRYDRMRRISWLEVDKLHDAKCLVVGAGALGNEVVKCMVLAGFCNITVVDMDRVVVSNLSRCLFFRDTDDQGTFKSNILVKRAAELNPDIKLTSVVSKIQDLESWDYDIIFGCLDNISARLHVNSHAKYHKIPYIDGATDGFRGKVQVILSDTSCLECMMNCSHMQILDQRFSCTGNGTIFQPKTASEITTTSIIAAVQVREAMKILSGRKDMCIHNVMYYNGETGSTDAYELSVDPCCPNHDNGGSI
jgi:molybdopterin-synthase adenylyltransferase